ncbi:hypothetical protein SEA_REDWATTLEHOG_117 [Gordonia phage RedWattleHog]|uniref:Uncharacterized protein n=1 Tax=Gordonia phage Stormageddon TaxID=2656541 RepID=A0A649VR80_9CAUD|nr:hypothetical protein KHQ86_gp184 [Gordonia phage Stormageddon]QGJ94976.1 hypothetical protein SEA_STORMAGEDDON_116 [Gordonia phage Stormageddon]QLF83620.1 hypothetical protein SEA_REDWATTLEHOG_117 [Gordonia phage RedWattleHog]
MSERNITTLSIRTRHPEDYVLINEADGTRWRGSEDMGWLRDDIEDDRLCGCGARGDHDETHEDAQ